MAEAGPWLTIIGIGEDGPAGLSDASRIALERAEILVGASRHLALVPDGIASRRIAWPVPFALDPLLAERGRRVVMLASGDPFWFGAGSLVAERLAPGEWTAHPAPSSFALAAARLGWPIERCQCLGLHAAPLDRLRPLLAPGVRAILLLRDGAMVGALAEYLRVRGFAASTLHVLEALGGPAERVRRFGAADTLPGDIRHPVAVALEVAGTGDTLACVAGIDDGWFAHDGQISKRPMRALALSALAPRPGEHLWDIGAGSGAIGIEWLLAHPHNRATGFERDPVRAERAADNARRLGVDRMAIVSGSAPDCLFDRPPPDAVFVGGGLSAPLLAMLATAMPAGTRIVAHAVTLESEMLLAEWHDRRGGTLLRIELAEARPLGSRRGWRASYPVVQWSAVL